MPERLLTSTFLYEYLLFLFLFCFTLPKRRAFPLRYAACTAVLLILYWLELLLLPGTYLFSTLGVLSMLALSAGMLRLCYQICPWQGLFAVSAAFGAQCIFFSIYIMFRLSFTDNAVPIRERAVYYAIAAVVLVPLIWFAAARRVDFRRGRRVSSSVLALLLALELLLDTVFKFSMLSNADSSGGEFFVWKGFSVLCNVLILIIQIALLDWAQAKEEKRNLELLLHQQQKQFQTSQASVDLIQMKYHDLKKMLAELRRYPVSAAELDSMEAEIDGGILVETGNEALSVILTEKKIQCMRAGIRFTCIADMSGFSIDFIDLYSLFANLLDNAIEAASHVPDPEKRVVSIVIRAKKNFLTVHCENYYTGEIRLQDGLPVSRKGDSEFHGFGLRSARETVQKYNGSLDVSFTEDLFCVNALISGKPNVL